MELVTLKTYHSSMKAHMDRIKLETEGIPCFIFDEQSFHNVPLYNLAVEGIRLKVRDEDVVKALGILSRSRQVPDSENGNQSIHCPRCQSTNVKSRKGVKSILSTIVSLLLATGSTQEIHNYKCHKCGEEFKLEVS